jgi:hypothetical protein
MIHFFITLTYLVIISLSSWAGSRWECTEEKDFFAFLSGTLGDSTNNQIDTVWFPCDTMVVNPEVNLNIHPGTILTWEKPDTNNLLWIKGKLNVLGTHKAPVTIGTQIQKTDLLNEVLDVDFAPKEKKIVQWQGLKFDSTAVIIIKNLKIKNTPTPLRIKSRHYNVDSLWVVKGSFIELPDTTIIADKVFLPTLTYSLPPPPPIVKKKKKKSILFPIAIAGTSLGIGALVWYLLSNKFSDSPSGDSSSPPSLGDPPFLPPIN